MLSKSLSTQIVESLPAWRGKFLSCKELRKRLKLIIGKTRPRRRRHSFKSKEEHEMDFFSFVEAEMDKLNAFLGEKEEEYIIRLKELQDRYAKEELVVVEQEMVDLRGEMVLLENYSALNYIDFIRMIKKYEKRSGAPIRLPLILQQPFYTSEVIHELVKQGDIMVDHHFPADKACVPSDSGPNADNRHGLVLSGSEELEEIERMEGIYLKSTITALRALK